jgi:hypothetical protein
MGVDRSASGWRQSKALEENDLLTCNRPPRQVPRGDKPNEFDSATIFAGDLTANGEI